MEVMRGQNQLVADIYSKRDEGDKCGQFESHAAATREQHNFGPTLVLREI